MSCNGHLEKRQRTSMRLTSTKDDTSKVHGAQPTLPGTRTSHGNKSELSPPAAPTRLRKSLGETDSRKSVNSKVHATSRPVRARVAGGSDTAVDKRVGIRVSSNEGLRRRRVDSCSTRAS